MEKNEIKAVEDSTIHWEENSVQEQLRLTLKKGITCMDRKIEKEQPSVSKDLKWGCCMEVVCRIEVNRSS